MNTTTTVGKTIYTIPSAPCIPWPITKVARNVIASAIFTLTTSLHALASPAGFPVGPLYPDGIEPGDPSSCEAPPGKRCWWVDAAAPNGGNGSFASPYNSFERVAGYWQAGSYFAGQLQGGDVLYVKGTFSSVGHDPVTKNKFVELGRQSQSGTETNPTIIKSWRGTPRAVFDGGYVVPNLIHISGLSNAQFNAVLISNIEVTKAAARGIFIDDEVVRAQVKNVVAHLNKGDGFLGTGGAIAFYARTAQHHYSLSNSLIYSNNEQSVGGDNNLGGVTIHAQAAALNGSEIEISGCEIHSEIGAIRHKHSGNIRMHAHHNYIHDSKWGFYLRSYDNDIHNNIITNVTDYAFHICSENQAANSRTWVYQNTILEGGFVELGCEAIPYRRDVAAFNNIIQTLNRTAPIIVPGMWSDSGYDLSNWVSDHNLFELGGSASSNFVFYRNQQYSFNSGLTLLSDTTSFDDTASFVSAPNDLRLNSNSAAKGAGRNNDDLGAFGGAGSVSPVFARGAFTPPSFLNQQGCGSRPETFRDGIDQDCDGYDSVTAVSDADADGSASPNDCDDLNRDLYPGKYRSCQTTGCSVGSQICQANGSFSACSCSPVCEAISGGRCFYVSPLVGSDSSAGSFAAPWKSLANIHAAFAGTAGWKTLQPGDFIYLMPGLYSKLNRAGTDYPALFLQGVTGGSGAPITISAYGDGVVTIEANGALPATRLTNVSNLTIRGVRVTGSADKGLEINSSTGITIDNAIVYGIEGTNPVSALQATGSSTVTLRYSRFSNNFTSNTFTDPMNKHRLAVSPALITSIGSSFYNP